MPVYTAEEITGNAKPTLALRERGLKMKAVPMSRVAPTAVTLVTQPVYQQYIQYIEAFMNAYVRDTNVTITDLPLRLQLEASKHIPFLSPTVVFSFKRPLTSEENETLKQKDVEEIASKKKEESSTYKTAPGFMTADLLKFVIAHDAAVLTNTQTIWGQANLKGFIAFLKARALLTAFTQTQYYPAFRVPSEETCLSRSNFFKTTRKEYEGMDADEHTAKRARIDNAVDEEYDETEVEAYWEQMKIATMIVDSESVPTASPPPVPYKGFGAVSEVPATFGNVFPYFEGLVDDDSNFISGIINEYFLLALSDTRGGCASESTQIRQGLGQFAASSSGRALSHAYCGVLLAIKAQAQVFYHISSEGKYSGFSIHGANYIITISNRLFYPEPYKGVAKDLQNIDEHSMAVAKLLQVIAKKEKAMKLTVTKRKISDIKSPRALYQIMKDMNFEEAEKKEIFELAGQMSFPQTFWRMSVRNILSAVTFMVDGVEPPADAPMYIGGGNILTSNLYVSVFALFGELGFSFKTPGGQKFPLPASRDKDELFKEHKDPKTKKVVKPMKVFVIMKKTHLICALDFKEFIIDRFMLLKQQRSAAFKSEVIGGPQGKELWFGLIDRIPVIKIRGPEISEKELEGEREVKDKEDDLDDLAAFFG